MNKFLKKLLAAALFLPALSFADPVGPSGTQIRQIQDEGVGLTRREKLNFTGSGVNCVDNAGNLRTDCTITAGGGGASSLEVFNNFDGTRSSPTASIGLSDAFRGTVSGSTYTFRINFSSVASKSDLVNVSGYRLEPATVTPRFDLSAQVGRILLSTSNVNALQGPMIFVSSVTGGQQFGILVSTKNINDIQVTSGLFLTPGATAQVDVSLGGSSAMTVSSQAVSVNSRRQFRLGDSDNSNYAGFVAPTILSTNLIWRLPLADASGCLSSDGSGNLSITTCGSGGGGSALSVGTGTASNFVTNVTSPTSSLSFLGTQFNSVASGTTNFLSIKPGAIIIDKGQKLSTKLKAGVGSGDAVVTVFGDSTGNETGEWVYLLGQSLASLYPSLAIDYYLWNTGTLNYGSVTAISTGTTPSPGVVFEDTFSRVVSELYLSTPDIGPLWGRDGSNASGDWSTDGTKAVRSTDSTSGTVLADAGVAGDFKLTVPFTLSTLATGSAFNAQFTLKRLNSTNRILCTISMTTAGVVTWSISKVIAGVSTTIQSGTPTGALSNNTAGQSATLEFSITGTTVTASLNGGVATLSGNILPADVTTLSAATVTGVNASSSTLMTMDSYKVELTGSGSPQKLTIYNCSAPGTILSYQQVQLSTAAPVEPDLLIASTGHNYSTNTASGFFTALDSFLTSWTALYPNAGVAFSSQNPQKSPAANKLSHQLRQVAFQSYAETRGAGYIPVFERWAEQPNGGVVLISTDGVHPTQGSSNSGSSLWRDTALDFMTLISNYGDVPSYGSGIYAATATASFPYGLSASTISLSVPNTTTSAPIQMRTTGSEFLPETPFFSFYGSNFSETDVKKGEIKFQNYAGGKSALVFYSSSSARFFELPFNGPATNGVEDGMTVGQVVSSDRDPNGNTLNLSGTFGVAYSSKTASFSAQDRTYLYLVNAGSGSVTATFPSMPVSYNASGRMYRVCKTDSSTNTVTFSPTIGATLTSQYDCVDAYFQRTSGTSGSWINVGKMNFTSSGGGSSIYPATSTIITPFGISGSTAVFTAPSATVTPLRAKMASAQTASGFEVQDSGGNNKFLVGPNGKIAFGLSGEKTPAIDLFTGSAASYGANEPNAMRLRATNIDGNTAAMVLGVVNSGVGGANQGHGFIQTPFWGGSDLNVLLLNPLGGPVGVGANYSPLSDFSMRTSGKLAVSGTTNSGNDTLGGRVIFPPSGYIGEMAFIAGIFDKSQFFEGEGVAIYTSSGTDVAGISVATEKFRIGSAGNVRFISTNTAAGVTGARTIDRPVGTVNFAAGATSLTVTNSLVTTASKIFATIRTNDATATIKNVVPASGSFTINLGAAATAETSVGFLVID